MDIERCSSPGLSSLRYFFARFDGFLAATSAILAAIAVERAVENGISIHPSPQKKGKRKAGREVQPFSGKAANYRGLLLLSRG
ncbi:MAG TPA: hypothetical protein VJR04_01485 [Terriglobales bacterium]|nr:hypothetical protein [Terriglobales bacterium]